MDFISTKCERLEQNLAFTTSQLVAATKERDSLSSTVQLLRCEIQDNQEKQFSASATIGDLQAECARIKEEIKEQEKQRAPLQILKFHEKEIELLKALHQAKLADYQNEFQRLSNAIQATRSQSHQTEVEAMKTITQLREQLDAAEKNAKHSERLAFSGDYVRDMEAKQWRSKLNDLEIKCLKEENLRREAEMKVAEMTRQMNVLESEGQRRLAAAIEDNASKLRYEFQYELDAARRRADSAEESAKETASRQLKEVFAELSALKGEHTALLQRHTSSSEEANSRIARLQKDLDAALREHGSSSIKLKKLQEQHRATQGQFENVKKRALEAEAESSVVRGALDEALAKIKALEYASAKAEESHRKEVSRLEQLVREEEAKRHLIAKRLGVLEAEKEMVDKVIARMAADSPSVSSDLTPHRVKAKTFQPQCSDTGISLSEVRDAPPREPLGSSLNDSVNAALRAQHDFCDAAKSSKMMGLLNMKSRPSSIGALRSLARKERKIAWNDLESASKLVGKEPFAVRPLTPNSSSTAARYSPSDSRIQTLFERRSLLHQSQ
jgi:chromosome segregation ATPase